MLLSFYLAEICLRLNDRVRRVFHAGGGCDEDLAGEVVNQFPECVDGINLNIRDQRGFGGIASRHEKALVAVLPCLGCHGEDAADVPDRAVERKFADDQGAIDAFRADLLPGDQHADRNWQVKKWTFLAHGSRSEIDRQRLAGIGEVGIFDGGINTLTAFLNGFVRQTDNRHVRLTRSVIDFHINNDALKTDDCARVHMSQHTLSLSRSSLQNSKN